MKRVSLLTAAAVVLVANAFALLHVRRNRSGPVESDITLTERELAEFYNPNDEDSGIALTLRWIDPQQQMFFPGSHPPWLDQGILRELGFDTSVSPSDKTAVEFYARQRPRRAFVALEYDGPSWRTWIDDVEQRLQAQTLAYAALPNQRETSTRLMAIDASRDIARLRARHPDRHLIVIVPAVLGISVEPQGANNPSRLYGSIQEIPSSIHVPLPFSETFRRLPGDRKNVKYRVQVRYGAFFEPWIVKVAFPTPTAP